MVQERLGRGLVRVAARAGRLERHAKDILGGHLLDNFSLRWGFVTETMFRNDFRFFPLAR